MFSCSRDLVCSPGRRSPSAFAKAPACAKPAPAGEGRSADKSGCFGGGGCGRPVILGALMVLVVAGWAQSTPRIELLDGRVIEGDPSALVSIERRAPSRTHLAVEMRQDSFFPVADIRRPPSSSRESETSGPVSLSEVSQIQWRSTATITVASGPDTECVSLGDDLTSGLPSDWAAEGAGLDWLPAQTPRVFHMWRHIPGAQWTWSEGEWFNIDHRERVILRQTFEVPEDLRVVEATLMLGVDDTLIMGRLNGVNLPLASPTQQTLVWDVTHAVGPGSNRLALVALDNPRAHIAMQGYGINAAGLAFRLEITGVTDTDPAADGPTCIALLDNGDRISGHLRRIDDSRVFLDTDIGGLVIDRDWVNELLVSVPTVTGRLAALTGDRAPSDPLVFALPRSVPPWAPGILLTDGTHLSGRVLRTGRDGLVVKPRYTDAGVVPLSEIRAIYMNAQGEGGYFHYPRANGPRVCRLTTLGGIRLSGLLLGLDDGAEVNPPESTRVEIPQDQLLRCVFPLSSRIWAWNALRAQSDPPSRRLAIWGHRRAGVDALPYTQNLVAQINQLALDLDFQIEWIDDVTFASGQITAQTHPLLFIVDEREEFPLTIREPRDGLEALTAYARSGGTLVLIPAGIPFYHGREWTGGQWQVRPLRQDIPTALGFNFLAPGHGHDSAHAFEIPDNRGETLVFERVASKSPWNLLPGALTFPPLDDSRFRPILPVGDDADVTLDPIYRLVGDQGSLFGTAMAALRHTEGDLEGFRIYHITPALAHAVDESGEPALHRLLPIVIADAFSE